MHDNKVRLSRDVLAKADQIAAEWGLKNARAAVEAVFRCYCDEYLHSREGQLSSPGTNFHPPQRESMVRTHAPKDSCEALDALDELLAL